MKPEETRKMFFKPYFLKAKCDVVIKLLSKVLSLIIKMSIFVLFYTKNLNIFEEEKKEFKDNCNYNYLHKLRVINLFYALNYKETQFYLCLCVN